MVARRRREEETYEVYRHNLRMESRAERIKLKGKWVWRSFIPHPNYESEVAQLTKGLTPKQAQVLVEDIPWHKRWLKMPPFRKQKEVVQ